LSPLAASASTSTTQPGSVTLTSTPTTTKADGAWATFLVSWKTYVSGLKTIDATYKAAVASVKSTYEAAKAAASTPAEKQAARVALAAGVSTALGARVASIVASGDPPAPPAGYRGSAWVVGFQSANVAFRAAVVAAQGTLASALSAATTGAEELSARSAYRTAITAAEATHESALATLGPAPKNPGKAQ
jgi:hypothetical protein